MKEAKIKLELKRVSYSILKNYLSFVTKEQKTYLEEFVNEKVTDSLEETQEKMKEILDHIWTQELQSGEYVVVSWNKYAHPKEKPLVVFATLCKKDHIVSFCNIKEGIEYQISYSSILGACPKDGATLIEASSKENEYTIAKRNGFVINSYNHATIWITPIDLLSSNENDYLSKHNELILDPDKIKEIGPFQIGMER